MKTPEERRLYERTRRAAWRAKNPEHVRAYAKHLYDNSGNRERREDRPCAEGKPETMKCRTCGVESPFDVKHFNVAKQNVFKLTYHCRKCMLKRHAHSHSKRTYGLSDEAVRHLRSMTQCCICGEAPEEKLRIDHCHATGQVRGVLCGTCNSGLGFFKDNPKVLRMAAAYVELFQAPPGGVYPFERLPK